ncbi:transposase [Candidatus Woesearchaeota archaeon]|nr:transposase [Candidatus Woesearchaeota archaeon]
MQSDDPEEQECPNCGNTKHHEIVRVEIDGKESRLFRCKACGYTEYILPRHDEQEEQQVVEKMGDAFREFLKKKHTEKDNVKKKDAE